MFRNTTGQVIGAQLVDSSGAAVASGTTNVFVTKDGGTQAAGGNTTATHEGNGFWTYVPTASDSDADHLAFTFVNAGAVPTTVQVYTRDKFSSDVLNASARAMVYGTVGSGSTTTSVALSTVVLAGGNSVGANALAGRRLYVRGDSATANARVAGARITANTAGATPTLTLAGSDALPVAPASGDVIVIA